MSQDLSLQTWYSHQPVKFSPFNWLATVSHCVPELESTCCSWCPLSILSEVYSILLLFFVDSFLLLLFKYSCLHFHPTTAPPIPASHPWTYPFWLCPCVPYTCSLMALPLFSPIIPLSPPLWLLSVSSLFQCLWLYFACLLCWLGSTYRWDCMVLVFHCQAYFT